ncbi:creatininase family protein [Candidatus Hydrogenedentota bacterium]
MKRKIKYEEMMPEEFLAAVGENPVFILPTGLLEWHGNHLPLGFDSLKIYQIALKVGERARAIVLPPNYWGGPGYGSFAGTLVFSDEVLEMLFLEIFAQLEKVGARVIALLSGHWGTKQESIVKGVAAKYMETSRVRIFAMSEFDGLLDDDGRRPGDHACKYETSYGLALIPELVKMDKFEPGTCEIHRYGKEHATRPREESEWVWEADVHEVASAELGQKLVERSVDFIVKRIEDEKKAAGL